MKTSNKKIDISEESPPPPEIKLKSENRLSLTRRPPSRAPEVNDTEEPAGLKRRIKGEEVGEG